MTGVALGALVSRPLVSRRAWSVLLGAAVCIAVVIVPHGPPARQLLVLFNETGSLGLPIVLIGAETVVIAIVAVSASLRIAERMA